MNKNVIITGVAGNMGKSIAERLLSEGYHIHGTIGPNDDPAFLKNENLVLSRVDLLDKNESRDFVTNVTEEHGDISGILCIVGGFATGGLKDTSGEDIQKMIQLNFLTAYHVVQPLISSYQKKKKKTQIILVGSRPALNPEEGKNLVAYSLSKSLLFQYADLINEASNETGISATVLIPGILDTQANRTSMADQNPANWVPLEKIADTISFALSETGEMMKNPIYKLYNKS